ncbi:DedA family protein [Paenibacillus sp. MBLB4367]|uniref:DedA family protein n=1 Tax=Paenibacillus sp. MBLB4367 TaxID=3384767 RepID=UPI003907FA6C
MLEFIALPFPGETTMAYAGYLSYAGSLNWIVCMLFAVLGTTIGMTITYMIGYFLGMPFIKRFGKWVLLSPEKVERTRRSFGKYGNVLLFVAYFIPGVRHLTGYFSGIVRLPFRTFALYAYSGAVFWVIFFVGLGKLFGAHWEELFRSFEHDMPYVVAGAVALALAYGAYYYRQKLKALLSKRK